MTQAWDFVDAAVLWGKPSPAILDKQLFEVDGFMNRTMNALGGAHLANDRHFNRIDTLGELLEYTEAELLRYPNFGRLSLFNVKKVLAEHGLELKRNT